MKRIIYILVALSAVWFAGCQEDQLEGEMPGKEVPLTFNGRSSNLSLDALTAEVDALHLLIFNEDGTLYLKKEFAGLASVTPVKLPLGKYTFAYLSNIDEAQIGGIGEGATLDKVTVSLKKDADGDFVLPGSIFSGKDEITIGEDEKSNAELSRLVGRMDVNVKGLKSGVELKSVTLLGSPETIRFDGSAEGNPVRLKVPMSNTEEMIKGEVIAFPTCRDSIACLEFQVEVNGEVQTHVSELKNKVEANKIHTINANVNVSGGIVNVTIEMNVEPWGETVKEDLTVNKRVYVDSLMIKVAMEPGASLDIQKVNLVDMQFTKNEQGEGYFSVRSSELDPTNPMTIAGDTLVIKYMSQVILGNYILQRIELLDSSYSNMYVLPAPVRNLVVDSTGCMVVTLPKMKEVAANDLQAMLDLRDVMKEAGVDVGGNWNSDNINLWYNVELDDAGRVIGIGYSELDDLLDEYDRMSARKANTMKANASARSGGEVLPTWNLPNSFKNLTALKHFNMTESSFGSLAEVPSFIKELPVLEELSVVTDATTLPELPETLRYLCVSSSTLTTVPAHIGNLGKLEALVFTVPYLNVDEEIGDYFPVLTISRIASMEMDFSKLTNLKYLYLVATPTCTLPGSVWSVTGNIVELGIAGFSKIQVPGSDFTALRSFAVANENMEPLDIEAIKNAANLEDLNLYSPVFGKNGLPDWMGQITTLRYITLDSCGVTSIPESFSHLTNLYELYLPRNPDLKGQLPSGLLEMYNAGDLYVSANESIDFSPDGILLYVDREYVEVPAEGEEYIIEVRSNSKWTCRIPDPWTDFIRVTFADEENARDTIAGSRGVLNGEGKARLRVIVEPNNPYMVYQHDRSGRVVIEAGRHTSQVTFYQKEVLKPVVSVSPASFSVRSGDTFVFDVTSNTWWNVDVETVSGDGMITPDVWYGTGNGQVRCTLETQQDCSFKVVLRDVYGDKAAEVTVTGLPASGEIPRDSTNMK